MKTAYSYQIPAIELCKRTDTLELDDRGLGKTYIAISAMHYVGGGFPKLIICNKQAREQWKQEILDEYPDDEVLVFDRMEPKVRYQRDCWMIMHHWVASKFTKIIANNLYGAVCADECHRFKNRDTDISKAIKRFETLRKIGLSGTPIEHGPRDFFSVLQWLHPHRYTSLWDFNTKYAEMKKTWTPNGYKLKTTGKCSNPSGLAAEIAPFSIRRTKSEVAHWLPPKRIFRVPVSMNPDQQKLYNFIDSIDDIEAVNPDTNEYYYVPNQMSKLTKLHQVASNPAILDKSARSSKLEWVDEYIRDNPDMRCIITSRYRSSAVHMSHRYNAALVIGGHEDGLSEFKSGGVKHLVGTIGALGESHSLPMADVIICIDQDYNGIIMDQVIDRHHRINTTLQKDVIMLYTPNTVDDLVLECIDKKWTENELIYAYLKGMHV